MFSLAGITCKFKEHEPTHILSVDWNDVVNVMFHASLFLQSDPLLIEGQEVFF